jgi:hypothetical protein
MHSYSNLMSCVEGMTTSLCWVCVIFFACVCVGTSDMTTASDDPSYLCPVCVMCIGHFHRGVPGGASMPPWLCAVFG